jgi:adenine-specific DNA-methyltransferase
MHGIRLLPSAPKVAKPALPLLAMNSVSLLGAEIFGRSYGGGILKMEPGEAAVLPVPNPEALAKGWELLKSSSRTLDGWLADGRWADVVRRVDDALLHTVLGLESQQVDELHRALETLRTRRVGPGPD